MKKILKQFIAFMLVFALCGTVCISDVNATEIQPKVNNSDNLITPRAYPDDYQTKTVKFGGGNYSFTITVVTYHDSYRNTWHLKSYYSSGASSSISTSSVRVGDQISSGQRIVFNYKAYGDYLYTGSYTFIAG